MTTKTKLTVKRSGFFSTKNPAWYVTAGVRQFVVVGHRAYRNTAPGRASGRKQVTYEMRIVERLADGSRNLLASFPAYSAPRRKAMEAIQKLLANEAAILEQLATPTAVLVEAARAEQIASDAVLEQIAQPIAPPAPIESVGAIEIDMTPAAEQPAPQVPDGDHLVVIDEVRPGVTRSGDERWALRLRVAEGPFFGRQAAWDSLVFSTRGRARARLVLRALGFTEPKLVIEPKDLVGRRAMATIRNVTYATPDGTEVRRGEVPYDGYRAVGGAS